jgi:hypothetical protein
MRWLLILVLCFTINALADEINPCMCSCSHGCPPECKSPTSVQTPPYCPLDSPGCMKDCMDAGNLGSDCQRKCADDSY